MASLSTDDRRVLMEVAVASIQAAVSTPESLLLEVDPGEYPPRLREHRASFVTLHCSKRLRGCRGTIAASEPLVTCTARSARAAAIFDERFDPVTCDDIPELELHISVLTTPKPIPVSSERELLAFLQCGVHGLVLRGATVEAVFLPSVWEKLPDPAQFVEHLKAKAGLPARGESPDILWEWFTAESFEARAADVRPHTEGD